MALSQPCFTDLALDQQLYNIYKATLQVGEFEVGLHDQIDYTYFGATNNKDTEQYLLGGNVVATITYVYFTMPPTVNNANIATKSIVYA
jgi:hypothetical protein